MDRKHYICKFCKWEWLSNKNPKRCPRCNNPTNKSPTYKTIVSDHLGFGGEKIRKSK